VECSKDMDVGPPGNLEVAAGVEVSHMAPSPMATVLWQAPLGVALHLGVMPDWMPAWMETASAHGGGISGPARMLRAHFREETKCEDETAVVLSMPSWAAAGGN